MAVSDYVTLVARPDYLGLSSTVLTEDSQASTDLAVENLQSTVISKAWRPNGNSISNTGFQFEFKSSVGSVDIARSIGGAALIGHDLSTDALWRLKLDASAVSADMERLAPTAIVGSSGVTNHDGSTAFDATGLGQIDEDCDSPDSTYAKFNANGEYLNLGFNTPSITVWTGDAVQEFRIKARRESGTTVFLEVALYESGAEVRQLGYVVFTDDSTLEEFTFLWDASELAAATGANAEILVQQVGTGEIWVDCLEWNCVKTNASYDYDSGYLSVFDANASNIWDDDGFSRQSETHLTAAHVLATQADYVIGRVEIVNPSQYVFSENVTYTGDFYQQKTVNVGACWMGPKYVPTRNAKVVDIKVNQFGKRVYSVQMNVLDRSEALYDLLAWAGINTGVADSVIRTEAGSTFVRGRGGPFAVLVPQPNEAGMKTIQDALVRLASVPSFQTEDKGRMIAKLELEEW